MPCAVGVNFRLWVKIDPRPPLIFCIKMPRCVSITVEGIRCSRHAHGEGQTMCSPHRRIPFPTQDVREHIYKSHILKRIRRYRGREGTQQNTIDELLVFAQTAQDALMAMHMARQQEMEQIAAGIRNPVLGEQRFNNAGERFVWDGRVWLWMNNHAPAAAPPAAAVAGPAAHRVVHGPAPRPVAGPVPRPGEEAVAAAVVAAIVAELIEPLEDGEMPPLIPIAPPPIPEVAAFVRDAQNVHRADTIRYVYRVIESLKDTPVPENQKTVPEIITECNLTPRAIITLTIYYYESTEIYGIPNVYPKTLDSIWSFVKTHPEKNELIGRVRDELTDNIGMCAHGNLSRLCNILSGYLDGATPPRARHEILQERLAAIAQDDEDDKVARARMVLAELEVPPGDWAPWLAAF